MFWETLYVLGHTICFGTHTMFWDTQYVLGHTICFGTHYMLARTLHLEGLESPSNHFTFWHQRYTKKEDPGKKKGTRVGKPPAILEKNNNG